MTSKHRHVDVSLVVAGIPWTLTSDANIAQTKPTIALVHRGHCRLWICFLSYVVEIHLFSHGMVVFSAWQRAFDDSTIDLNTDTIRVDGVLICNIAEHGSRLCQVAVTLSEPGATIDGAILLEDD